jgi:hypothetical protein
VERIVEDDPSFYYNEKENKRWRLVSSNSNTAWSGGLNKGR